MNYIKYFITFLITFLAPISNALIAILFLIGADLIMGLIAARKVKEKITSNKLSKTLIKILVYEILVISSLYQKLAENYNKIIN